MSIVEDGCPEGIEEESFIFGLVAVKLIRSCTVDGLEFKIF